MPSRAPLDKTTVWLTRPAGQGATLRAELERLGATVQHLPLLAIEPFAPSQADRQKLIDLDRYDLVFYVSTNAATLGLDAIAQWWPQYPAGIGNFAVGSGTAAVLEQQGLQVSYPRERMSSEALLALPGLQAIAGKKALIVRGAGGREIIAEGLRARGATVDYVELYARSLPDHPPAQLHALLHDAPPSALVVSSADALDNLKTLFAPISQAWVQLPLVVSSVRLAEHAAILGFQNTAVVEGASDVAIIQGLLAIFGNGVSA
jgi:uroporphyrinogen-III synthase